MRVCVQSPSHHNTQPSPPHISVQSHTHTHTCMQAPGVSSQRERPSLGSHSSPPALRRHLLLMLDETARAFKFSGYETCEPLSSQGKPHTPKPSSRLTCAQCEVGSCLRSWNRPSESLKASFLNHGTEKPSLGMDPKKNIFSQCSAARHHKYNASRSRLECSDEALATNGTKS